MPLQVKKFLWDFQKKTIGELIAENHYDVIGDEYVSGYETIYRIS